MFTFFTVNTLRSQFYPVQSVTEKITFTADEGGSSVSERRDFWNQAWLLSRERPLFGWGPYSFRFVQPRLQTEVLATSDHPHNVFLKLAMERGLPAAILFAIVIICIVFHAVKSVQFSLPAVALAEAGSLSIQTVSVLIAVLGVLAHNLIDFNLQFVGIALPFWLLLSMLVPSQQQDQFLPVVRLRRGAEIALAALLLVDHAHAQRGPVAEGEADVVAGRIEDLEAAARPRPRVGRWRPAVAAARRERRERQAQCQTRGIEGM
jgi:hypothetical protein